MKKIALSLALVMALALCPGLVPTGAAAPAENWRFEEVLPCEYLQLDTWTLKDALMVQRSDGKWGIVDRTGEMVVPCQYDELKLVEVNDLEWESVLLAVRKDGKWGLIDQTGQTVIPCQYDDMISSAGYKYEAMKQFKVEQNGKWGILDETGAVIVALSYSEIRNFSCGYAAVADDQGRWGFIDWDGTEIVSPTYAEVQDFGESYFLSNTRDGSRFYYAAVADDQGRWGFIDWDGEEVIPPTYSAVREGSVYLTAVADDQGRWGFVNLCGEEIVIPPTYTEVQDFSRGYAAVADDQGRWGFVNGPTGTEVIPCQYSAAGDFASDQDFSALAAVETEDGVWQFIDGEGTVQITCQGSYDRVDAFDDMNHLFAITYEGQKQGLVDRQGREVLPCQYDRVDINWDYDDGTVFTWIEYENRVTRGEWVCYQYGLLSGDGTMDTGLIYETSRYYTESELGELDVDNDYTYTYFAFNEGLSSVSKYAGLSPYGLPAYRIGYIDRTGTEVIPCQYDDAMYFSNGLAAVCVNDLWGFIDRTGQVVIPLSYQMAQSFDENGLAAVATGTWPDYQWGVIDEKGNTVVPCSYACDTLASFNAGDGEIWFETINFTNYDDYDDFEASYGILALVNLGAKDLELPVSGVLSGAEEGRCVDYACSTLGRLTLEGELEQGEVVLAAMYDDQGRLIEVETLTAEQASAWLDATAYKVKLFWLDGGQAPQSPAAMLWSR